jgi:pyruvyltransferase
MMNKLFFFNWGNPLLIFIIFFLASFSEGQASPPLYFWNPSPTQNFTNFGDELSKQIVERLVGYSIEVTDSPNIGEKKFLAIGSIMHFAQDGDLIWGTGVNGKNPRSDYRFTHLDVRAVRGPLTRNFLISMGIECPEVYGDPTLLMPKLFPEFQRSEEPIYDYVIVPHYSDEALFEGLANVVNVKENWEHVVRKILNSRFVISTSLSGIIVAEAFGIPARLLRIHNPDHTEDLFKYQDYYYGTNRFNFRYATTVKEAFQMGGEPLPKCDLEKLYQAFPFGTFTE